MPAEHIQLWALDHYISLALVRGAPITTQNVNYAAKAYTSRTVLYHTEQHSMQLDSLDTGFSECKIHFGRSYVALIRLL